MNKGELEVAVLRIYSNRELVEQFELDQQLTKIGRADDNQVVLEDDRVSKHHATIEEKDGRYTLFDNNSSNGVYVGQKKVNLHQLEYWDEIHISRYVIKFMETKRHKNAESEAAPEHNQDATRMVSAAEASKLLKAKKNIPTLLPISGKKTLSARYNLDAPQVTLGKSADCDVKVGGFFSPKISAKLETRGNATYLVPVAARALLLNDAKVTEPVKLNDGDRIQANSVEMEYRYRL